MLFAYDPDDLIVREQHSQAKHKGPCQYHLRYFGEELIIERNIPPTRPYTCEDCKRKRRMEKELTYMRPSRAAGSTERLPLRKALPEALQKAIDLDAWRQQNEEKPGIRRLRRWHKKPDKDGKV